jgi:hypothetical protein
VSTWLADELFAGQRFSRNALRLEAGTQLFNWLALQLEWRHGKAIFYDPEDPFQGRETVLRTTVRLQPTNWISSECSLRYSDFVADASQEKLFEVLIWRNATVLQINKYLFFRIISEYNTYRGQLREDVLLSFTWIPGTVVHLGYGSQFEQLEWQNTRYVPSDHFLNAQRAWFFKASYRWRK